MFFFTYAISQFLQSFSVQGLKLLKYYLKGQVVVNCTDKKKREFKMVIDCEIYFSRAFETEALFLIHQS